MNKSQVKYELLSLPKYGTLDDLKTFIDNIEKYIGQEIVDLKAYDKLKTIRKVPKFYDAGRNFKYPDLAKECTFVVTSEMITNGNFDQCSYEYEDGGYTAFIVYRPQFDFEKEIEADMKKEREEYERQRFMELKKKYEGET